MKNPVIEQITTLRNPNYPKIVWVIVKTTDGLKGIGETSYDPDTVEAFIQGEGSDYLLGKDPSSIDLHWEKLSKVGSHIKLGNSGEMRGLSALDMALWDIKGKALNKPVWDLLGGKVREKVPVYSHVGFLDKIETAVSDAVRQVNLGYKALKLDPFMPEMKKSHRRYIDGKISEQGASYADDLMSEIRKAIGPSIELMIDAHGNFDVSTATELCNRMKKHNLIWFEEPLQPESIDAHRQLRNNTDINLCIGERKYTRWDFAPYLQEGLVNYIMPDICWTGGISEMKRIATLAETFYIPISPHDASGAFNVISGAHVLMNVPNIYRLEMTDHSLENYNNVITEPLDIRDGFLHLNNKPGLGYELNHDFIKSNPDPEWEKIWKN